MEKLVLSPSILAADFSVLGKQIREAESAGAQYLHIDVMDGSFVPSISFGMPVVSSIRGLTDMVFDVHLMIEKPERYVEEFARIGADIITFHLEATDRPDEVIANIHSLGKKAGLSIKPATPVEAVLPFIDGIDMLLVMTVEPGFGGQSYIPASTGRIRRARELFGQHGLQTDIQVDGGITVDNVHVALEAGANVIVAGSAVFKGDIGRNVKNMFGAFERFRNAQA